MPDGRRDRHWGNSPTLTASRNDCQAQAVKTNAPWDRALESPTATPPASTSWYSRQSPCWGPLYEDLTHLSAGRSCRIIRASYFFLSRSRATPEIRFMDCGDDRADDRRWSKARRYRSTGPSSSRYKVP